MRGCYMLSIDYVFPVVFCLLSLISCRYFYVLSSYYYFLSLLSYSIDSFLLFQPSFPLIYSPILLFLTTSHFNMSFLYEQIKSKGTDFNSGFWKDLEPSILPLHRAVSGLHFHGSLKLLLGSLNTLIQLGADTNMTDKMGNTALHKAITMCTSRCVIALLFLFKKFM